MALAITDDHRALADVARSVVEDRDVRGATRAELDGSAPARPAYWKDIVAAGWLGLHIGEAYGGEGAGLGELLIVTEELGRAAAGGPFLPTVLAAAVIDEVGTEEQRATLLPGLCDGSTTAAVGLSGSATVGGDDLVEGDAGPVLGAVTADLLLLPVGEDLVVVSKDASVRLRVNDGVDPTRAVAGVRCTGSRARALLAGGLPVARRIGAVLAAAEAVGGMRACTEMTVAHVATREQFGRPVGSFQAVKHHCADMLLDTEIATATVWDAMRPTGSDAEADLVAALTANSALAGFDRVAKMTIQLHGGIAYTWEHEAHRYLRRALALEAYFGHRELLAERVVALSRAGVRRARTLELPPEAERHRDDARTFLTEYRALPEGQQRALFARSGYLVPHWPKPYGRDAGPVEQLVIEEELVDLDRPDLGLGEWVIPTILQHGTQEQRERLVWPSLEGELRWCQLFSEPGAGSDAASISTRARRVEGGWRIDGQKVWTSDARNCQRGLATVRTDPGAPKHRGITAVIIDMAADGVEVRPLREITGEALFNEVFFDGVFVPDADVVGAVNDGWRVARDMLGHERLSIGSGSTSMQADALVELLDRRRPGDIGFARQVGDLLTEWHGLTALNLRHAARAVSQSEPGVEGSLAKLFAGEHAQRVADTGVRIAGAAALLGEEAQVVHDTLFTRCLTIAGGTSEVLRNQIAERVLGLPREPAGPGKGTRA